MNWISITDVFLIPLWFSLFPFVYLCLSLQYKKHRLSVGLTNNYAKSVVNMADMVRIILILFLESLPQALPSIEAEHCSDFSFNKHHSLNLKPPLAHNTLQTAINQPVMSFQDSEDWSSRGLSTTLRQTFQCLIICSHICVLCYWNLTCYRVVSVSW